MTEPVHKKVFGGVKMNWNEVKSAQVNVDKKNNKNTYNVTFKTGVRVEYPEQTNPKASIYSEEEGSIFSGHDTSTRINYLDGAKVTGSRDDDYIRCNQVKNSTIDVSKDHNDDEVEMITTAKNYKEFKENNDNNTIMLDEEDTAKIYTAKGFNTLKEVEGPGIENP